MYRIKDKNTLCFQYGCTDYNAITFDDTLSRTFNIVLGALDPRQPKIDEDLTNHGSQTEVENLKGLYSRLHTYRDSVCTIKKVKETTDNKKSTKKYTTTSSTGVCCHWMSYDKENKTCEINRDSQQILDMICMVHRVADREAALASSNIPQINSAPGGRSSALVDPKILAPGASKKTSIMPSIATIVTFIILFVLFRKPMTNVMAKALQPMTNVMAKALPVDPLSRYDMSTYGRNTATVGNTATVARLNFASFMQQASIVPNVIEKLHKDNITQTFEIHRNLLHWRDYLLVEKLKEEMISPQEIRSKLKKDGIRVDQMIEKVEEFIKAENVKFTNLTVIKTNEWMLAEEIFLQVKGLENGINGLRTYEQAHNEYELAHTRYEQAKKAYIIRKYEEGVHNTEKIIRGIIQERVLFPQIEEFLKSVNASNFLASQVISLRVGRGKIFINEYPKQDAYKLLDITNPWYKESEDLCESLNETYPRYREKFIGHVELRVTDDPAGHPDLFENFTWKIAEGLKKSGYGPLAENRESWVEKSIKSWTEKYARSKFEQFVQGSATMEDIISLSTLDATSIYAGNIKKIIIARSSLQKIEASLVNIEALNPEIVTIRRDLRIAVFAEVFRLESYKLLTEKYRGGGQTASRKSIGRRAFEKASGVVDKSTPEIDELARMLELERKKLERIPSRNEERRRTDEP
jgi:hypothetical protein